MQQYFLKDFPDDSNVKPRVSATALKNGRGNRGKSQQSLTRSLHLRHMGGFSRMEIQMLPVVCISNELLRPHFLSQSSRDLVLKLCCT